MSGEDLIFVHVPSLVSILLSHARQKGAPLTEEEVLAIRDHAACVALPAHAAAEMAKSRGYDDVDADNAWEDWNAIRPTLGA